jgi:hypothetical protein
LEVVVARTFALLSAVLALMPACASIVAESTDTMQISSAPSGATVSIVDKEGREVWHGLTPSSVALHVSDGYFSGQTFRATATLAGYEPAVVEIDTRLCNWYWGNFLFGGIIGFFAVDPATGSMWDLPEIAPTIELTALHTAPPTAAASAPPTP